MQTEEQLIELSIRGDRRAYEQLYRSHAAQIYGLCLRMCGDRTTAEDLTQEAFVLAWKKLRGFQGSSSFKTWMSRLSTNLVIDHLRSRKRWQFVDYSELEEAMQQCNTEDEMDLAKGLALLPEQARTVLVLFDYFGYKHEEISRMTGLAEGTCKAHLHRARTLLKKGLSR